MTGIYMYENKINGKKYIGQSVNISRRKREHKSRLKDEGNGEHESSLHKAFRKYGFENFEFKILELCSAQNLNEREIYWVDYYNSYKNGYNQTSGGFYTAVPIKMTEDKLEKITESLLKTNKTYREIADENEVSVTLIHYINTGENWFRPNIEYPIRNNKTEPKKFFCKDCGTEITRFGIRCNSCAAIAQRKAERPEPIELARMVVEWGFEATGKYFGVSGSTIRKWCKSYDIGGKKAEVAMWYIQNK